MRIRAPDYSQVKKDPEPSPGGEDRVRIFGSEEQINRFAIYPVNDK